MAALFLAASTSGCQLATQYLNPARYLIEQARELEAEEKFAEAVAQYEQIIQKHPKKKYAIEALTRAAALYEERLNNWQKAAIYLQELRSRTEGKKQQPSVLLRLGRVLEHAGTPYADALETYGFVCKNCAGAPEALTALLSRGRLFEAMQSWAQAKSVYEEALAKLGTAPQAGAVRVRLQWVWFGEALSLYAAGRVHEGAALASEALTKSIDAPEVRGGLENIDRQFRSAKELWKANAGALLCDDWKVEDAVDDSRFPVKAVRNQASPTPDGWKIEFNEKRKSFVLTEKPDTAKGKKPSKPWTLKSPPEHSVLGFWWSPDGAKFGWIAKAREGRKRYLSVANLAKRRSWTAVTDLSGKLMGETLLFLPFCDKMVFPYEDYLVVSDVLGGQRAHLTLPPDRKRKYSGALVEWVASSVDALELAVGVRQLPPKTSGGKKAPPPSAPPGVAVWRLTLGVLQE